MPPYKNLDAIESFASVDISKLPRDVSEFEQQQIDAAAADNTAANTTDINAIVIPRAEDLPYWTSPPIQFVYQQTAPLGLAQYTWTPTPGQLLFQRPLLHNALYFFRNITLTADVADLDFQSNVTTATMPRFQMYLQSTGKTILFREDLQMPEFFQQFTYPFWWETARDEDQLFGSFNGILSQGFSLIGKTSVTLTAVISAQEVTDDKYINLFKSHYPQWDRS